MADRLPAGDDALHARLAVTKENRIAAHAPAISPGFASAIDTTDPRWVLAMQTQSRLQGTTLTLERRNSLLENGAKLGLRPFESNLIISIVQDRARAGMPAGQVSPMLSLVCPPAEAKAKTEPAAWPQWLLAFAAAAALAAALIRWLTN